MIFEWDPDKEQRNIAKYGVSFELVARVWDDPFHVILPDRVEHVEQRWHAIGMVGPVALLLVVPAIRTCKTKVGFESLARDKATRRERKLYEEGA